MADYDPKLPTLVLAMPRLRPEDLAGVLSLERKLAGRYNGLVVAAESALVLPPEDPDA